MKKKLFSPKKVKYLFYSLCFLLLGANLGFGQTIVTETFGTAAGQALTLTAGVWSDTSSFTAGPYGSATTPATSLAVSTITISGDASLSVGASASTLTTASRRNLMGTYPAGALASALNANTTKEVVWTFNMRGQKLMGANYSDGTDYSAVILGSTSNSLDNATVASNGSGYAVVMGRSTANAAINSLHFVKFTNGLTAGSTVTTLAQSAAFIGAGTLATPVVATATAPNNISVKVVYSAPTNTWKVYYREDASNTTAAYADPSTTPTTNSLALVADSAYTNVALPNFGFLVGNTVSSNVSRTKGFDNFTASLVTPTAVPNAPTAFTATQTATPSSSVDLSWAAASGTGVGSGYVVVRGNDVPVEGTSYAAGNTIGTSTVVFSGDALLCTDSGLAISTTYNYKVYK